MTSDQGSVLVTGGGTGLGSATCARLGAYAPGAACTASTFGLLGLSNALRQGVAGDLVKVTDIVVATAVESGLSDRTGVRRLPSGD